MAKSPREPLVGTSRRDSIAVITLDRPERLNTLGAELIDDLVAAIDDAEQDDSVRAAVISGAGRGFSSGGDLADVSGRVADGGSAAGLDIMQRLIVRLQDSRLPFVAAVHRPAYGAGFSLALACDVIVATHNARFCQVFVHRALVPDLGSAWLLPRVIGPQWAKELMLFGEEISGTEA